jgi:hypothetical protein
MDVNFAGDEFGSRNWSVNPSFTWKPSSNVSLELGPSFERNIVDAQYVDALTNAANTATFGKDYLFAYLDQSTAAASIRVDCAITPALSVQFYAQPLISSVRYTDYRTLARPRSYEFNTFDATGRSDDFTYRTVRGNAVVRWEYLPGSTLFAVWTQTRTGFSSDGEFRLHESLSDVARVKPDDVFLVKVSRHFEL